MLKPIVDSVIEKAPSRYALVIGVAKRARSIVEKAQHEGEILVEKPVGIAVEQLLNHEYEIVELTPEEIAAQEAAQAAADTYLAQTREANEKTQQLCDRLIADAQRKADAIVRAAQVQADAIDGRQDEKIQCETDAVYPQGALQEASLVR